MSDIEKDQPIDEAVIDDVCLHISSYIYEYQYHIIFLYHLHFFLYLTLLILLTFFAHSTTSQLSFACISPHPIINHNTTSHPTQSTLITYCISRLMNFLMHLSRRKKVKKKSKKLLKIPKMVKKVHLTLQHLMAQQMHQ